MSDGGDDDEKIGKEKEDQEAEQPVKKEPKKKVPPTKKGTKNDRGDYVITTIDIPDMRTGVSKSEKMQVISDSDSDSGYGDEDEPKEEKKVEEAPAKEGK